MNIEEAKAILDGIINQYREKSYDELVKLVNDDIGFFTMKGESGTAYEVEIDVFFDEENEENTRVDVVIDTGIISSFFPMREGFTKTPQNGTMEQDYENPLF